ncbi:MAG: ankyrin repeat domain-containing protein, partial [Flavobacteriales bacterium]
EHPLEHVLTPLSRYLDRRSIQILRSASKTFTHDPDLDTEQQRWVSQICQEFNGKGGWESCEKVLCKRAARDGDLKMLQWARQNGCPWDESTCAYAAEGGHLKVLQWAFQNGCPWDWRTCAYAAEGGYLEVLQWARENGCPWDWRTCAYAAKGG